METVKKLRQIFAMVLLHEVNLTCKLQKKFKTFYCFEECHKCKKCKMSKILRYLLESNKEQLS